jgi:protein phosphatase
MTSPDEAEHAGRPGSTLVAVLVHPGGVEVAHVGDSRAYLLHSGQVFQLTKDHSMVQRMVDDGLITPEQALRHPEANKILRALGMSPEVEVELRPQGVVHAAGDVIVLCSDGLSDLVKPEEILGIAGAAPPEQAAGQLVDLANARGGYDNITVAIVRARESAVRPRDPVAPTMPQTPAIVPPAASSGSRLGPNQTVLQAPAIPAPPSTRSSGSPRLALRVIAVIVGLVGVLASVIAIYLHNEERKGARRAYPDAEPITLPSAPPRVDLTPIPHPTADPMAPSDDDSGVTPLFVEPDASRRRRRRDAVP